MQIATIARAIVDDTGQRVGGRCSSIEVTYTEGAAMFQRQGTPQIPPAPDEKRCDPSA